MQKIADYIRRYYRYLGAGVLFILLIFILSECTGPGRTDSIDAENTESTEVDELEAFVLDDEFVIDGIEELNELIESYFMAYASNDMETIDTLAYPMTNNEKSYIGVFSQYIEEYQNITCYSKTGLTEGSYLVSVYYELKFYNVSTTAPGLEFFYVETDEEGNLYINNRYSSYNLSRTENELNASINAVIIQYQQQEDVAGLLDSVNDAYTEAVSGDLDLAEMITTTIPAAMADWLEMISSAATETEVTGDEDTTEENTQEEDSSSEDTETETESEQETESESESESEMESESEKTTKVRATTNVYIRKDASTNSAALDKALEGEEYTKVGEDGDWTIIEYDGGTAYIKTEFLEEVSD